MSRFLSAIKNSISHRVGALASPPAFVLVTRQPQLEPQARYQPGGYHPVRAGEIYNERYRILHKLGWGQYSTVWLVQDMRDQRLATMKILVADLTNEKAGYDERAMLVSLRETNPRSLGYHHIRHLLDDFIHEGPNGTHVCLVLEPMSVNAVEIYHGFKSPMPLFLVRRISAHVLRALCYLHEECHLIHTDIKGDNILMSGAPSEIEQTSIQLTIPELASATFKLADFGEATCVSDHFAKLIQPEALRSPEVIIKAPWDTKTDIWNFGALMYQFARGAQLFDPYWDTQRTGMSRSQTHIAQIVGLLGQFPRELVDKGENSSRYFDRDGRLLHGGGLYGITIEDLLRRANHPPEELPLLADFLLRALTIDPEERWSASQLLKHSWLEDVA
ncbi:hypothetical protein NLJ89_g10488 [Agrocybe chaxingu]|uniref:non-specific serine/threonine protein kinase n=1 Tax=Agrocybe chaxingu TaxID=84603 RepID=A0A9W8JQN9_9AGAR|nr:hypothetical protein NLJ89_g10488 [Agrocybe chaxingu]